MILIQITLLISVWFFGPKLMNYVYEKKEKVSQLSTRGILLSGLSAFLAASFMTFFILMPIQFILPGFAIEHSLSFFAIIFAFMIGAQLTSEAAPDIMHYLKSLAFLLVGGLFFWPIAYYLGQILDTNITSVTFFSYSGVIEFSTWMMGMTLLSPTLVELTERYL